MAFTDTPALTIREVGALLGFLRQFVTRLFENEPRGANVGTVVSPPRLRIVDIRLQMPSCRLD